MSNNVWSNNDAPKPQVKAGWGTGNQGGGAAI